MPDHPPSIGPFRLTTPRSASAAGTVHSGQDAGGRAVTVVLLAEGPAGDAAARDRFAAAVSDAHRHGDVLLDGTAEPRPWVALASGTDRAAGLLDAVLPRHALGPAAAGPTFEPHWQGSGAGGPRSLEAGAGVAPDAGGGTSTRWVVGGVAAAVALVLAGIVGWGALLSDRGGSPTAQAPEPLATSVLPPVPDVLPTEPGQAPSGPSEPPGAPGPDADGRPLETTGPGVAGPSYTPQDETTEMRLDGLPFAFRAPLGWECTRDDAVPEPAVRYDCRDAGFTGAGPLPGGVVEVRPCPAPCTEQQWAAIRLSYAPLAAWRPVDAQTAVVEDLPQEVPGTYRIRMSRVFSSSGGDGPDTHVLVELTGGPEQVETLQKIVNDVRANTE